MGEQVILRNEYVEIYEMQDQYHIKCINKGYSITDLNEALKQYPRIRVTQVVGLQQLLSSANGKLNYLGNKRPVAEVTVSKDKLEATMQINLTAEDFKVYPKDQLIKIMLDELDTQGVVFGVVIQDFIHQIALNEKIVVAKGILPVMGEDAVVKYYEINEVKPQAIEDGKVNHYELNLINKVTQGDWLGDRTEPTEGIPGKNVMGEIIPPRPGKQVELVYDKKTIDKEFDKTKNLTTLYAKKTGAVVFENGVISVCNFLEIEGNVSFKTGNVDFDGFVNIKDSVEDNFSVAADNDIQILGDLGIGGVESVESRNGSVYIRGGIAGKNKARIISNGDIFLKFASDCYIESKGTVHVGFYVYNCRIKAKEVVLESMNGRIYGGYIEADIKVEAGEIGNRGELLTEIKINGFDRNKMKADYDLMTLTIDKVKDKIAILKQKQVIFGMSHQLNEDQQKEEEKLKNEIDYFRKNLTLLYAQRNKFISYLNTKGEGEIRINRKLHPNVKMTVLDHFEHNFTGYNSPISYYVSEGHFKSV